jgi:hypothetical protein
MNLNPEAIVLFFAGILAQAIVLLLGKFTLKDAGKILLCWVISLAAFIPGSHGKRFDISFDLLGMAGLFAIAYAVCFKEKILERINREILMVWTLVGLYNALQIPYVIAHPPLLITLIGLSLVAAINAFAGFDRYYGWRVYFYAWFLCLIVSIVASKFAYYTLVSVFGFTEHPPEINPWTMFIIGMMFLYLVINLWYVYELIPLPGKHQSFSDRLRDVEEDLQLLADDYDVAQVRRWMAAVLLILTATLLAVNYTRHVVNDTILLSLLIAAMPVLNKIKFPKPPAAPVNGSTADEAAN